MKKIPINFEHEGKKYSGILLSVSGAGNNNYHLMIDNYYRGQLIYSETYGWQFYEGFKGMAEYFGDYIVSYKQ